MKIEQIVKANNMPVQTVELKDKTGKGRTYNAKTYKTHGQAQKSVATFKSLIKKARKTRSDKGKSRAPYNIIKKFDPNAQLKKEMKEVNKNLLRVQKELANNQNARGRKRAQEDLLTSRPAALQAVENWADADSTRTNKFFYYAKNNSKTNKQWYVQFNVDAIDELEKIINDPNSTKDEVKVAKEEKRKLKEMIEGNGKTDFKDKRVGMLNAKSLTKEGREEIHQDAYETFIKEYKNEIGIAGMTREEYDEFWILYNDYKEKADAEGAFSIFYSDFSDAIKNGLLQMDTSSFEKWLIAAVETSKQKAQLTKLTRR